MIKYEGLIQRSLREDIGRGDITTRLFIADDLRSKAKFIAKEDGVVCGLEVAKQVFKSLDKNIKFSPRVKDGRYVRRGDVLAEVSGKARSILTAERSALNFLSHLSGIATQTKKFVDRVKPYDVKIMDTRKTLPGLRQLEKYAVRCGGGYNHRMSLGELILIKDNHIKATSHPSTSLRAGKSQVTSLKKLIEIAKKRKPEGVKIEIEVEDLRQFKEALEAKPDIIMLDNMSINDIRKAVYLRNQKPEYRNHILLESSGNVKLNTVRKIAKSGVDIISIGGLTHSAPALDISLKIIVGRKA